MSPVEILSLTRVGELTDGLYRRNLFVNSLNFPSNTTFKYGQREPCIRQEKKKGYSDRKKKES